MRAKQFVTSVLPATGQAQPVPVQVPVSGQQTPFFPPNQPAVQDHVEEGELSEEIHEEVLDVLDSDCEIVPQDMENCESDGECSDPDMTVDKPSEEQSY